MKKSKAADEVADLKALLHKAGLRSTTARIAVLRQLRAAIVPLSHAELAKELVPTGLDRATVYRNLMDLAEANLAARVEVGDHVWRYELRRREHEHDIEHPHFVCVDCGRVQCLTQVKFEITPKPGTKASSISSLTEVLLKGHCGECV